MPLWLEIVISWSFVGIGIHHLLLDRFWSIFLWPVSFNGVLVPWLRHPVDCRCIGLGLDSVWLVSAAFAEVSRFLKLMVLKLTRQKLSISSGAALNLNWSVAVINVRLLGHDDGSLIVIWLSPVWLLLIWWHLFLAEVSLLVEVLELDVDHAQLLLGKTEGFSVGKSLNSCQLIQKNQIIILNVEVNGVQVLPKNLGVNHINSSLFKAHVHNTAQYLEKILKHVFFGMLIEMLGFISKR